jgi:membrane associated rhomboid family serine protease
MFFIPYGTVEPYKRRLVPFVTWLIVAANVLAFAYELLIVGSSGNAGLNDFLQRYAVIPSGISGGLLWPGILTSLFLHGGVIHLLGNMIYLLPFGDNVEDRMGHGRYLLFYLICGVVASLTFVLFNPHDTVPMLGASGAIAGVLGGYLALHRRGIVKGIFFLFIIFFPLRLPAFIFIGYWFLMQLFSSIASIGATAVQTGGVAFVAHVGGFLAGLVLAPLMAKKDHPALAPAE